MKLLSNRSERPAASERTYSIIAADPVALIACCTTASTEWDTPDTTFNGPTGTEPAMTHRIVASTTSET